MSVSPRKASKRMENIQHPLIIDQIGKAIADTLAG